MIIKPVNKQIICKKSLKKEQANKIILMKEEPNNSVFDVVAVSDEIKWVHPGDRVIVKKFTGADVPYNGEVYTMFAEESIMALVQGGANADYQF